MPEVVDEGGILADPHNAQAIAEGILRITQDETLRQQLVERGLERARQFRWEAAAQNTLRVIEDAYSSS
jgi:glycosyltransferase involved in cell wall biosynthesis